MRHPLIIKLIAQQVHAPRVCAALVGELHADRIRGTPTLPALGSLPSEKENLTEDEKQPGHFNPYPLRLCGQQARATSKHGNQQELRG